MTVKIIKMFSAIWYVLMPLHIVYVDEIDPRLWQNFENTKKAIKFFYDA